MTITIETTSSMMTSRTAARLWNDLNREQAQNHADNVLPLHFEWGAYQRYNYKTRTRKYSNWKFKTYGHRNPNVKTGSLRRIVLATASADVRATASGWTVRGKGTSQHKMWRQTKSELEQISPIEERRYVSEHQANFVKHAGSPDYQFKKRTVIRKR